MISMEKNQHIQDIARKLRNNKLIPFVGAGMSKPLGLPDWDDLVEEVAIRTNQDPPVEFILTPGTV